MKEQEELKAMVAAKKFSRGLESASDCAERITSIDLSMMQLQAQVGGGKLSLPDYLELCRGQIPSEERFYNQCVLLAKWFKANGADDLARYHAELASWYKRRAAWLKEEIENAPDEEDEEE
jgi:hypothetical protein